MEHDSDKIYVYVKKLREVQVDQDPSTSLFPQPEDEDRPKEVTISLPSAMVEIVHSMNMETMEKLRKEFGLNRMSMVAAKPDVQRVPRDEHKNKSNELQELFGPLHYTRVVTGRGFKGYSVSVSEGIMPVDETEGGDLDEGLDTIKLPELTISTKTGARYDLED